MLLPLAYWGMWPAVRDIANADGDPAFEASYYRPLNDFLERQGEPNWRVEIPFTRAHFEAAEVAPDHPLARGWQRQLDAKLNDLFYEGKLTHSRYERWLRENGVRFVAVSDATIDFSSRRERELASSPAARRYLKPVWRSAHWQVFELRRPGALAVDQRGPGRIDVERLPPQGADLRATGPAAATVRVRYSALLARPRRVCGTRRGVDARRSGSGRRAGTGAEFRPRTDLQPRPALRLKFRHPASHVCHIRVSSRPVNSSAAVIGRAWRWSNRLLPKGWLDLVRQILLFAAAYYLYRIVRGMVDGKAADAFENARVLVDVERSLNLFFEADLQNWALSSASCIVDAANFLYVNAHIALTLGFLVWLYLRRNDSFYFVRNMFMIAMGLALVLLHALPDRPAALLPRVGLHRHRDERRRRQGGRQRRPALQPVRGVPSMHVAFALMVGIPALQARQDPRGQVALVGLPGDGHDDRRADGEPLLDRRPDRRARRRPLGRSRARGVSPAYAPRRGRGDQPAGAQAQA